MKTRMWVLWVGVGAAVLCAGGLFAFMERPRLLDSLINYPNPFDSRKGDTTISYRVAQDAPVRIGIYDLFGCPVKEFHFAAGEMGGRAGENTVRWDGRDSSGNSVSKGGYICQVVVEGDQPTKGIRKIGVIH